MNLKERLIGPGGYVSYYRSQLEPCLTDAQERDIRNMEILGFSRLNPIYIFERIKQYFTKIKRR